jgi:transcriptional regulator with XRE-family HTH domain
LGRAVLLYLLAGLALIGADTTLAFADDAGLQQGERRALHEHLPEDVPRDIAFDFPGAAEPRMLEIPSVTLSPMPRAIHKNQSAANLFREALAAARMTIEDLVQVTGYERGTVGALVRGEVRRPDPDVLNEVCGKLGIPVLGVLEAFGYNVAVRPKDRLPAEIADLWPRLPAEAQRSLLALARAAATPRWAGDGISSSRQRG